MTIEIVPPNPQWPVMFDVARSHILKKTGMYIIAIEHIGSTAVPGLWAKPTIDIMIGVQQMRVAIFCIAPLESLGYDYRRDHEALIPERRYFEKLDEFEEHTHHIHMVEKGTPFWRSHILFRDYLRAHPHARDAYSRFKIDMGMQFRHDRAGYVAAKAPFIEELMHKAHAWAQQIGQ